ncbi:hypothetical protein NK356_11525 [Chryseobacterium sp. S0630]|uniref:hypothetical protein n=1 Tax=Chryseobacterium sp. S0630 TaxID=2957803 RepID=UPI0020A01E8B|nr:hypothetical protein [Chryseobacterium sp. S0630]MCP1299798.1 hypothetical protein [Chryseobacterium sp. S0630]
MINYSAIIKDSSPYFFYRIDGSVLFEVNRKYSFPGYIFTIKTPQRSDLFRFEIRRILSTKIKILWQDFEKTVSLEKEKNKYKLLVDGNVIYLNEKFKILGKYEASIIVNEKEIGFIREDNIFPYKKYIITFNIEDNINFYCLILFTIISTHFADGV